jgi:hypothetical protein
MKICRTVDELLLGVVFHEGSSVASLEWNIETRMFVVLFRLMSWADRYSDCENRLNDWKVAQKDIFMENIPQLLPWNEVSLFFACWADSISILIVETGLIVEKLFLE